MTPRCSTALAVSCSALFLGITAATPAADFIRGDSDSSGVVNLTDAVHVLDHLFRGGSAPTCRDAADSNDDGAVDLSDAVFTLMALFTGETTLPAPGLACGEDPTNDDLSCEESSCEDASCPPLTGSQTEGPYYKAGPPERSSFLEEGVTGTRLDLSGRVLALGNCEPMAGARVDFWHCDDAGVYDNEGFKLRGHQFTDDEGVFYLETIVPGLYPGRTRHIHVKVTPPGGSTLTTQLYFPGEPRNATDGLYEVKLEMDYRDGSAGKVGTFDFVVQPE